MDFFTASLLIMFCAGHLSVLFVLGWYALKRTQKTWSGR